MKDENANNENSVADVSRLSSDAHALLEEFPGLFASENVRISIPVGWRKSVRSTLHMFNRLGLECRIDKLELGANGLSAHMSSGNTGETKYLNKLLASTAGICMLCGKPLARNEEKICLDVADLWDDCRPLMGSTAPAEPDLEYPGICPECIRNAEAGKKHQKHAVYRHHGA